VTILTTEGSVVDETLDDSLSSLESAENYTSWIFDTAAPFLAGPVLEVGAGHGTFTERLSARGGVVAVEPSRQLAARLEERHRDTPGVRVLTGDVSAVDPEPVFGSAVLFNVLEHIEDDAGALRQIRERLAARGSLVLWVPAFALLYSKFDEQLGHHRRYRRKELERLVEAAGFDVVESRYTNCLGWFTWLGAARILGLVPTSRTMLAIFDNVFVPVVRTVERGVRPPFGQSIFLAARRRD
jgi:SAM-dependent methyltransferase